MEEKKAKRVDMNLLRRLIILLAIARSVPLAWAEGPCLAGERMVGQQNVQGTSFPICQPISSFDSASQPHRVWADQWGAIAADTTTGAVGTVVGYVTRREAIEAAMRDCAASGGTYCTLKLTHNNKCAAGAWGPGNGGKWAWTGDPSRKEAEERAVSRCVETSGGECKLFYSDCS